jgi:hypothetical protein
VFDAAYWTDVNTAEMGQLVERTERRVFGFFGCEVEQ